MQSLNGRIGVVACLMLLVWTSSVRADDPAQIREAIEGLSELLGPDDLIGIYEAISEVPDSSIRQELKAALHAKLDALFEPKLQPADRASVLNPGPQTSTSAEEPQAFSMLETELKWLELQAQIEALPLGPEATVETLRYRDQVVAEISRLSDPQLRYELLELLAQRERNTQTQESVETTY